MTTAASKQPVFRQWAALCALAALRLSVGGVMLYSALIHLGNQYFFLSSVVDYRLLGHWPAALCAVVLPWVQLTAGLCLVVDVMTPSAFAMSAGLFLAFTGAQGMAILSGNAPDCGCFGAIHHRVVGFATIVPTSLAMVLCAMGAVATDRQRRRAESIETPNPMRIADA